MSTAKARLALNAVSMDFLKNSGYFTEKLVTQLHDCVLMYGITAGVGAASREKIPEKEFEKVGQFLTSLGKDKPEMNFFIPLALAFYLMFGMDRLQELLQDCSGALQKIRKGPRSGKPDHDQNPAGNEDDPRITDR